MYFCICILYLHLYPTPRSLVNIVHCAMYCIGPVGDMGVPGRHGAAGATGATGQPGEQGPDGPRGLPGSLRFILHCVLKKVDP